MAREVVIVDGGGANLASLEFALERLGARARVTRDAAAIRDASHVILPGVGAAAAAMRSLRADGLADLLPRLAQPVLGICLGLQLLAEASAEDDTDCLGIFPGRAERLEASPARPVPNMGWCRVRHCRPHPLTKGLSDGSWFYFVHSYALPVSGDSLAVAEHDGQFTAIAARDNYAATQFHPERSAAAGSRLLANFLAFTA